MQVIIKALYSITKFAAETELFLYSCPIVRALNYILNTKTTEIHEATFSVIKTFPKTQSNIFLHNSMPLIDYERRAGICSEEIEKCIETARAIELSTLIINAKPIKRRMKAS